MAGEVKGGLLKALRVCACSIGFTRMPLLSEQTRRLLCAAPAKGVATYMEEALCADIDACTDARTVYKTIAMLSSMLGLEKLKWELDGHHLPAPHKKSLRTALNRATKRLASLEEAAAKARRESAPARQAAEEFEMPEDCRKEDAQREAARLAAVDAMFAKVELS